MSLKQKVSHEEWQARVELAAAYRIFDQMGWSELIFSHLSLRVPGAEDEFLINPYGLFYDEICASHLIKVNAQGMVLQESPWTFNPAGFVTHGAIHAQREDARCIMHAHTTAGIAVAAGRQGLLMHNIYAAQLFNGIAYHDFEGLTLYPDEGSRLLQNLGRKKVLILRSHGLFTLGGTVAEAFNLMWLLNRACEIQVAAHAHETIEIPEAVGRKCVRDSFHFGPRGQEIFQALVRRLEKTDDTYKR